MTFDTLLIHTCLIERDAEGAVDDYNQPTEAWAALHTDEPCRLMSTKGREMHIDKQIVLSDWKLFVGDIDVTEQDRVTISGDVYNIILVQPRTDGVSGHHKELVLLRVE